jgi:hypothetical protein
MRTLRLAILLGVTAGILGCGSVDTMATRDGAAGAPEIEAGGGGGAGAAGMMTGAPGTGGMDTAGTGGAAGAAMGGMKGEGRPLGAGCAADDDCASAVCTTAASGQHMCCDARSTACIACVGGYQAPLPDGTRCGTPACDSTATVATNYACSAGACTAMVGCCMWSECTILGDPSKPNSSAICAGNGDDHGTMCTGACILSPGQRGCQI